MEPLLSEIDHVAIAVNDLDAAVTWYEDVFGASVVHREVVDSDGVSERLIDEVPRPGSRGTMVAFVHPKTAFGTLIELVQDTH